MINQAKTNNLNYSIDATFSEVNRLFVHGSFGKYYTPTVEMEDYNVVIDCKNVLINNNK